MQIFAVEAGTQDQRVLSFFQRFPQTLFGASQVWSLVFPGQQIPLTSARRSVTNLYKQGKLAKTDAVRSGLYDRYEHLYRLDSAGDPNG